MIFVVYFDQRLGAAPPIAGQNQSKMPQSTGISPKIQGKRLVFNKISENFREKTLFLAFRSKLPYAG